MIGQVKTIDGQKIVVPISGSIPVGNPVGTLLSRANGQVPRNYLECDGSTFNEGQYPALYLYLGTNVLPEIFDHDRPSSWETITLSTNSASPTIMEYDGVIYVQASRSGSQTGHNVRIFVNGTEYKSSLDTSATNYWTAFMELPVKKGDSVYTAYTGTLDKMLGCFYKSHLYIKAVDGVDISDEDTFLDTVKNFVQEKNSYSTTEMLTGGKWIDGKPIYRKVVENNTVSASSWQVLISSGFESVDTMVKICGILYTNDDFIIPLPWAETNYAICVRYKTTDKKIYIKMESTVFYNRPYKLVFEYTKTTD